jgi:hypothetical protein
MAKINIVISNEIEERFRQAVNLGSDAFCCFFAYIKVGRYKDTSTSREI